jgi:hypothetical protein
MIWLFIVPAVFLLIGVADMPGGYYTFMRIVVSLSSGIIAYTSYKQNDRIDIWTVLFSLMLILFNPIIPVYLHDKDVWMILDIAGAALFGIKGFISVRNSKQA